VFFESLRACRALKALYPEIDSLFGVPQPPKWHPEVDTGLHTMMVLEQATELSADVEVRFAALVHDLGKATTEQEEWPSHPGHELRGKDIIKAMSQRLPLPRACRDLGVLVSEFHTHCHRASELRDKTMVKVLEKTDAFRRPERFAQFLLACEADARGRTSFENSDYPQAALMRRALSAAAAVNSAGIAAQHEAADIPEAIRTARITAVKKSREAA
jgi:tRNA nucleotidyltransferase (CCA-adding enzyme)